MADFATPQAGSCHQPLVDVDQVRACVADQTLRDAPLGRVGLELEGHLVDRRSIGRRVGWDEVRDLVDRVGDRLARSRLSVEPGGQLELSTLPAPGLEAAVTALIEDERILGEVLRERGYGLAFLGLDPARSPARVNPSARYREMERYFDRSGCGSVGRLIMVCSAGLQLNLDAGPRAGWSDRLDRLDRLAPVLMALSACSPLSAGGPSGWASMRQQAWWEIDPPRTAAVTFGGDPGRAWADYALAAPVMLVAEVSAGPDDAPSASKRLVSPERTVSFADWVRHPSWLGRPPTFDDLSYHLTTLFPPVRPRGYLELRFLDAVPVGWWPGLAAIVGTLLDDPGTYDAVDTLLDGSS
ncbi:MAG TPA: glutamate-cysteine ligase family protein, partial [Microlunatus sp.]|nr:glutamate-cysteine ligase family protein [Microlunatus sp.]